VADSLNFSSFRPSENRVGSNGSHENTSGAIIPTASFAEGEGRIIRPRRKEGLKRRIPFSLSLPLCLSLSLSLPLSSRRRENSNARTREGTRARRDSPGGNWRQRGRERERERERERSSLDSSFPSPNYPACCLCRGRPPGPIARN